MKTLIDHLSQYAAYHRDPRNVATHFVGIPLIALAVATLLARPGVLWWEVPVSPASALGLATVLFHVRLDWRLGLVMAVVLGALVWLGHVLAAQSTWVWLLGGLSAFVIGWIIQFVGHHFEGSKPAFVDDVAGLLVGPLFLAAEVAFMLGWRLEVKAEIDRRLGTLPSGAGARAQAR